MTCHHGVTHLEDGEGDALPGLQPPVLVPLAQAGDLGGDLGQGRALVSGEQLLEPSPENNDDDDGWSVDVMISPSLRGQTLQGGSEDMGHHRQHRSLGG